MNELARFIRSQYAVDSDGIFYDGTKRYWSNLDRAENRSLADAVKEGGVRQTLGRRFPHLEEVIYSPKRQAGLELLELSGDEVCVDYGCMWGALTLPLARRTRFVLGIDQTLESLQFLKARLREEGIDNAVLLRADLNALPVFPQNARIDVALVNGVLEWVPETGDVELKSYYGKPRERKYSGTPLKHQEAFLKRLHENLAPTGKLYLAIENRYDFKMFFGVPDPHSNLPFTSLLPRKAADKISQMKLRRPYVNWTYSLNGTKTLLERAGFSKVDLYLCFPDYRFPEKIIRLDRPLDGFRPTIASSNSKGKKTFARLAARAAERFFFGILKAKALAPAIIAIGTK